MQHFEFAKWLKSIVIIAGVFALILFAFVVPQMADEMLKQSPEAANMYWPCLIFVWLSAIPLAIILIKTWKIFKHINEDKSFCLENSTLLKDISFYSMIECIWYFTGAMILAFTHLLNASILVVLGVMIVLGFAGAVCSAALSRLVLKASRLQDDNDLTI